MGRLTGIPLTVMPAAGRPDPSTWPGLPAEEEAGLRREAATNAQASSFANKPGCTLAPGDGEDP